MIQLQMEELSDLYEMFFLVFNFYHGVQLTKLSVVFWPFCVAFVALRFFSQGYIYSMQLVTKGTGESQFLMIFYWESKGG